MSRDQANDRHTEKGLDPQLRSGIERVIRAAMRSWAMTLRLCLLVCVVWAVRVVRAAMRSWAVTLRLCLLVSVVAATLTIMVCMIYPSVLPLFMG